MSTDVKEAGHWLRTVRESLPGSGAHGRLTLEGASDLIRERTKASLGEEVYLAQQALSRLEKGDIDTPSARMLCAVALGYRLDPLEILARYHYYPAGFQEEFRTRMGDYIRRLDELSEMSRKRVLDALEMFLLAASQIDRRDPPEEPKRRRRA